MAPKLQNIAKHVVLPPSPPMAAWHHPANGRFAEHEPILLNEFVKVTLGQMTPEKYAQDVGKQIQDIMDKPQRLAELTAEGDRCYGQAVGRFGVPIADPLTLTPVDLRRMTVAAKSEAGTRPQPAGSR